MIRTLLRLAPLACLLACLGAPRASAADGVFFTLEFKPFILETDIGATPADRKKTASQYMKWITETANYFLKVYELDKNCFTTYVDTYDPSGTEWEREVRFKLWAKHDQFLEDFQKRYESKSNPGAFFGWGYQPKDEYGKPAGKRLREIQAFGEGLTEEEILRHLYHEMGHLFMRTFIIWPVEVPSWIEEGTAEIFQFRTGNGTNPEPEQEERRGWLVEMIAEGSAIPWKEFMEVRNIDNLDFTWKDPLRSTIQYSQAWSVMSFMLDSPQRRGAFSLLLKSFKAAGRTAIQEVNQKGMKGDAARKFLDSYLYGKQQELFQKAYGGDLLKIEELWRAWVKAEYEKDVKAKPILRYHRGGWYLMRSEGSKDAAERTRNLDLAETIFNECAAVTPDMPETYVGLGRVALARGDSKAADVHFAKAAELGSNSFDALLYGGIALMRSGKVAEAVPGLTKAATMRPTHAETNYRLGLALVMSDGDIDLAKTHLVRARDLKNDLTTTCAQVEGMADYLKGNLAGASISFLRASNNPRGSPIPVLALALCKAGNGEGEDAEALLRQAESQGNPFAKKIAALIKEGKAPRLGFSRSGTVLVLGVTKITGEEEAEEPPAKPADPKPFDVNP